jgi:hypothetical protein
MKKINNIAVKSLGDVHGKRIIAAFEKLGVYTFRLGGCVQGRYYGVYDGIFGSENILPFGVEELTIEQIEAMIESVYPKVMLVGNDEVNLERVVVGELLLNGKKYFIAENYHNNERLMVYNQAKELEIDRPKEVHLTLEDISNGKGVGVPAHLIRIKK